MALGILNGIAAIVVIKKTVDKEWAAFVRTYVTSIGVRTGILLLFFWLGVKIIGLDGKVFPVSLIIAYFISKIIELIYVSKVRRIKNNLIYRV